MIWLKFSFLIIGYMLISFTSSIDKNFVNKEIILPPEEYKENVQAITKDLNLVPRVTNALNGTEFIHSIINLTLKEREDNIYREIKTGNIPDFLRNMVKVSTRTSIKGNIKYLNYYVLPDYLAIGSDEDYFLCPMTPSLAQKLADELDCFLPTRKMVDQIWKASKVKMEPQPIPPTNKMTTIPVFNQHNSAVRIQRQTFIKSDTLGVLVSGNKKDIIISNLIYRSPEPRRVIIYGWHDPIGKNIQPTYAGHSENYVDYSHGVRLIQSKVYVDDVEMQASQVLKSEEINSLLSDEGIIHKSYYPN